MNSYNFNYQTLTVMITNIAYKGDAFGATKEGEGVYISPQLAEDYGVKPGQERIVRAVPNAPEHAARGVVWRVFSIEPLDASGAQPEPEFSDEEIILDALERREMMSTGDIAALLGVESIACRRLLNGMHKAGSIVRADVFSRFEQTKASRSVWALDDTIFTPLEEVSGESHGNETERR